MVEAGEERLGSVQSFKTKAIATATVTTSAAGSISQTSATLNGSYSGATGTVSRVGFKWGTSSGNLNQDTYTNGSSSPFSRSLTGLNAGTTYYYKAYVVEYNENTSSTEYRYGSEHSFTTSVAQAAAMPDYLGCYEMPSLSLSSGAGSRNIGTETFGSTLWYQYNLTTSTRKVVTHTYEYNSKVYRNYTAIVDQNYRCPVLTAYVMHSGAYPNNGTGRVGDFTESTSYDPAIPNSWQSSGSTHDYNNGAGYARGHHCASEDRQVTANANKQTFYYTNQSPQIQNGFNGGIWNSLEGAVQSNAPSGRDTMYVVVGTLFDPLNMDSSNDGGNVGRPSHFYKCIMICSFDAGGNMTAARGVAYLFENRAYTGNYNDAANRTTIDNIESLSGFDLFANVPLALQTAAEATSASLW